MRTCPKCDTMVIHSGDWDVEDTQLVESLYECPSCGTKITVTWGNDESTNTRRRNNNLEQG